MTVDTEYRYRDVLRHGCNNLMASWPHGMTTWGHVFANSDGAKSAEFKEE